MNTMKICPACQKPLEANAPDGLCPECLLKAGLGTGVDLGPDSQADSRRVPFVAPTPEELGKPFPQLKILGFIGQGGMGAVYKARQKALDRVVALKILPPGIGKDPAFAQRFTREAKALAKLNHPGIVTLYEFGQADGLFFFLMEFVDGVNLRHLLEASRVSPREALAIVPQICDALQYAHDQGIVHRDIKPENILLDRQGRVKVADFGLAKLVGSDAPALPMGEGGVSATVEGTPPSAALTDAGKVMGTPQYMAPEQREHPTEVDHRADIYSLGVVFYQMLTGELPGKPIEAPSHTVRVDVRLDEVVLRALAKEPERRYQQVSQMKSAVETISQSCPPVDAKVQPADWRTWSPCQSPQVREICDHMTEAERREWSLRGALFGIWNAATFFVPWGIAFFAPKPLNWIFAPIVLLVGLAFYPLWRRITREFLASTRWARQQGIAPENLRMSPNIVIVGRRGDQAVIHWPGVLLSFVLILVVVEAGADFATRILVGGGIDSRTAVFLLMFAGLFTGMLVLRGLTTPVEKLTPLDGPGGTGPKSAGRKWPIPLVGIRNGQQVIHWPGLLRFAVIFVVAAGVFSLIFYWLAPPPRGLVVGLLVGSLLLALKLQQVWTTPIERSPRLDAPARSHAVWPWIVGAVGIALLVPVVVFSGFVLWRSTAKVETVRPESPNRVLEVRCEGRKAYIQAELDDRHDLHLFIGNDALGWSSQPTGSTSVTATVEASSQIKLEDGSMGRGLIFQAWGSRHYIAITPESSVPYGEVVFRPNSHANESGSFTFADIRQSNGTLIPVSIRVRPVSGKSPGSQSFGPVVERTVTSVFKDVATCFLDLDSGEFCVPPTNLWADLRGMADRGDGVLEAPGGEFFGWLKQNGADMLGCDLEHGASLLFFGTTPVAVPNPALAFDTTTPEQVANFCRNIKNSWDETKLFNPIPLHRVRLNAEPWNANLLPFYTREGGMGVMQVVGFTDNPRGMKIRYKLVQSSAARLQFRLVADANDPAPADTLADPASKEPLRVRQEVLLDGSAVARASVAVSQENTVSIVVDFNGAGTKRIAEITGANIGKRLAMSFDGKLLSAPTIRSVIRNQAVITGQLTAAEAEVIVNVLNAREGTDAMASKTATTGAAASGGDQAKPGASIDAEKLRRLVWGPAATNGLRAACYFEPTKEAYADGEVVKRWMVLHNSGKEPVRFDVGLGGHDDGWTVVDEEGQKVRLDHVAYAGLVPVVTFVLEPGHATEIECMSTGIGASTRAGGGVADTAIQAKPGTTCRMHWTLRVIETTRTEKRNSVTIASVWHGILTTGEVHFRIVETGATAR